MSSPNPSDSAASPFGLDSSYSDLGAPNNRPPADSPTVDESFEEESEQDETNDNELNKEAEALLNLAQSSSSQPENKALIVASAQPTVPSVKDILISGAINFVLPFINGMMLGFGEIFAHELGFRWGWSAARVSTVSVYEFFFIIISLTDFPIGITSQ